MKKTLVALMLCSIMLLTAACSAIAEDLVNVILATGTTQAFTDEAVAEEDVKKIVGTGLVATSAINQQPWYFAVLTDTALMEEISSMGGGMPMGAPPAGAPAGAPAGDPASAPPAAMGAKASLGDSPVAIIIYRNDVTKSPNADFDCGLACQNMVIAASAMGYGTKIVSAPTMTLNGEKHDEICEKLGVDKSYQAVAVLLIGKADADVTTSASVREAMENKVSFVK